MAEQEDSQEKTEEPTERRLEKAIEDGQLLSSKDTFVFATMTMGFFSILFLAALMPAQMATWGTLLMFDSQETLDSQILVHLGTAFKVILVIGGLFGLPMFLSVIATQALVGGLHFMPKSLSFKGSKLNPITGLGRIFSIKGLVELGKAILKVTFIGLAAGLVISKYITEFLSLSASNLTAAIDRLFGGFTSMIIATLIVLAAIAVIDYGWSLYQHKQKLKMSFKELKDENKETNGQKRSRKSVRPLQLSLTQPTLPWRSNTPPERLAHQQLSQWARGRWHSASSKKPKARA
jgi:flagellar biosynthetic protein FlhB